MRVGLNDEVQAEWHEQGLEHLRYEYDLSPKDLVIDIGAYQGEWAEKIFNRYGCQLIVIEPTGSILGFPHGEVINKAASTHDGTETFGGAFYYTSQHEVGTTEYPCFDINDLLVTLPEVALVKINIEGAEYELLEHIIGAGLHKRIRNLQVQFHQIAGEPYMDWHEKIQNQLSFTHKLMWFYPFVWENWERA
jgi:FkbM family methyltransferase